MSETNTDLKGADILVVDDTHANLRYLVDILSDQGCNVRPAPGGSLALQSAGRKTPDLVLLDINMPGMDGFEVCRELKSAAATRDIPVIFISALDDVSDKVRGFAAGGVDYVTKPFHAEEVVARVSTHLALRNLRLKMEQANHDLEERNRELESFAHTVAHDLKSPFGTISGFVNLLKDAMDEQEQDLESMRHYLSRIEGNTMRAAGIIDALLLLASVRREQVKLEPVNTRRIIASIRERQSLLLEMVEFTGPDEWPAALGYEPWVEEIWANYISNAVKYGGSPPRIEVGGESMENGKVRFRVTDNGPGIAPEARDRLFTEFSRLATNKPVAGSGLGLSIARRIAEKLGGGVDFESEPGAGSTFYFELPSA